MQFYHKLLNFNIKTFFIINIFLKNINNHYIYKPENLRKSNEEKNVIEIEINNSNSGNMQYINLNNNNNIEMYINDVKQSNFDSYIVFEKNTNYKIKLLLLNNFNGDCQKMFMGINLKMIKFQNFDVCKNMSYMFYRCSSLVSLNLSSFNTSNVVDMNHMFYACSSVDILHLSNLFTMKNVNFFEYMFSHYCIEIIYDENILNKEIIKR